MVDVSTLPLASEALTVDNKANWEFENFLLRSSVVKVITDSPEDCTRLFIEISSCRKNGSLFGAFKKLSKTKSIYFNGGSTYQDILMMFKFYAQNDALQNISIGSKEKFKTDKEVTLDFSTEEWRDMVLRAAKKNKDLIVLIDNVSNLFSQKGMMQETIDWLYSLKSLGITMFILFPQKNQYSYIPDDVFDVSLSLKKATSSDLSFKMEYLFAKNLEKPQCKPYILDHVVDGDKMRFVAREMKEDLVAKVAVYTVQGFTQAEIARLLGVHQSTVSRRFDDALNQGLVAKHGRVYTLTEDGDRATKNITLPEF